MSFTGSFLRSLFPLMQQWSIDIIDLGPSLHDENTHYLIRAYASLDERQSSQDASMGVPTGGGDRGKPLWH
jgi:hypothetical protein